MKAYKISDNLSSMFKWQYYSNRRKVGFVYKIIRSCLKNSLERFVKQRELVFEFLCTYSSNFFIRLSLGLNFYVHESAVSAPKSEYEHIRYYETTVVLQ